MESVYLPLAKVAGALSAGTLYMWRNYIARRLAGYWLSLGTSRRTPSTVYLPVCQLPNHSINALDIESPEAFFGYGIQRRCYHWPAGRAGRI